MRFSSVVAAMSAVFGALALAMTPAAALEQKPYDATAFKAAQDAGKPVVAHVTAPWCPTCVAQHQALESLSKDAAYADVTVFSIDFDSQADVWKGLNVRSQSTFVGFKGSKETGRVVGQTKPADISALLKTTVAN